MFVIDRRTYSLPMRDLEAKDSLVQQTTEQTALEKRTALPP